MQFRWKKQIVAMAVTCAVLTVASLSGPRRLFAQVRAALVQDVDSPGRAPFQASVTINVNNFTYTPVTIPTGKRLVIDYVEAHGAATSAGGPIQPIATVAVGVAGSSTSTYYFALNPSQVPGEFYLSAPAKIYADTLAVGPAYSGFAPNFLGATVNISGHLVSQ